MHTEETVPNLQRRLKVSVNENFNTLLDFVLFFLNFWHEWVLNFISAEKENQKVLFNPSKMSLSELTSQGWTSR